MTSNLPGHRLAERDRVTAIRRHQLILDSNQAAASEASVWVRTLAAENSLRPDWIDGLDLCAVELVANITDYAYRGGPGEIRLELGIAADAATLVLEDTGPSFDPLAQPVPPKPASLAEAPIGGYGIHLVRQFADDCQYERDDEVNRIYVVFGKPLPRSRHIDRRQYQASGFPLLRADQKVVTTDQRSGIDRRALGFISRTDLFRDVPYDQLELIVAGCRVVSYTEGELVLAAGQQSNRVWVVIEGGLRVHFDGPGSEDFLEIPCGECAGEISVADGKLSSAWVVAATASRLLEIDAGTFLEHLLTIPRVGRNLITILAERMRRSNQRISERVQLEMELKALQRELDFARRIQSSMLPANPLFADEARLDCFGFMRAARQVGGDFFDAMPLDADRYLVAIGDVCNKGMPAALFMAQTLALLRSLALRGRDNETAYMADLTVEGNNQLCRMNSENLFVSLFIAVVDLERDELRYVNAGHNPPLLVLPGAGPVFVEEPRNPVAGMVPDIKFRSGCIAFPPGSLLLLYTDGVTEAEASDNRQFGEDALVGLMDEAGESASTLIERIVEGVDHFAAGHHQADDITLLAVRRC
jgi:serine phosphatase RsbU (regulator of sigma subunit)/anti-sigma regulatory factor (Ser/Thr protein kinase)